VFDKFLAVHAQHANDKTSAEEWCYQDGCTSLVLQGSVKDIEFPDNLGYDVQRGLAPNRQK
jgi:hypothetical protein